MSLALLAGATLATGLLGGKAAGRAADVQAQAAREASAEQRRQFDITQAQMAPWREAGATALGQQQALLGMGTPEEQQAAFAAFADTPGQQFLREQQERSLLRSQSAIGGLGGGRVRTALQQQAFGRAQTDYQNQLSRLAELSGTGRTTAAQIGQFGAQTAADIGLLGQQSAAARASGIIGQQQARQDVLGTLAGIGQQAGIFNQPTTAYTAPAPTLPAPQFGGISGGAGLRPIPF